MSADQQALYRFAPGAAAEPPPPGGGVFGFLCAAWDAVTSEPCMVRRVPGCSPEQKEALTSALAQARGVAGLCLPTTVRLLHGTLYLQYPLLDPVPQPPTEAAVAVVLPPLLRCLSELHKRGLAHGHLKASNVVVLRSGGVCVTDFALALLERDPAWAEQRRARRWLSPYALPPEGLSGDVAAAPTPSTDVWGVGHVVSEILSGPGMLPMQLYAPALAAALMRTCRPPDPNVMFADCSAGMRALLSATMQPDAASRPKVEAIVLPAVPAAAAAAPLSEEAAVRHLLLAALENTGVPAALGAELRTVVRTLGMQQQQNRGEGEEEARDAEGDDAGPLAALLGEIVQAAEVSVPTALDSPCTVRGLRNYFSGKFQHNSGKLTRVEALPPVG